jgi:hypothetical protein
MYRSVFAMDVNGRTLARGDLLRVFDSSTLRVKNARSTRRSRFSNAPAAMLVWCDMLSTMFHHISTQLLL